jgi:hypothetical protein
VIAASDVPLWAALLVGLGGGVLGTLLTVSHERGAEMRTRMLDAADDYVHGSMQMANAARDLKYALLSRQRLNPPDDELDALLAELRESADELSLTLARIQLLFGASSATWANATKAEAGNEKVIESYTAWRNSDPDFTIAELNANVAEATSAIDALGKAARREVRFGAGARIAHRLSDLTRRSRPGEPPPDEEATRETNDP